MTVQYRCILFIWTVFAQLDNKGLYYTGNWRPGHRFQGPLLEEEDKKLPNDRANTPPHCVSCFNPDDNNAFVFSVQSYSRAGQRSWKV